MSAYALPMVSRPDQPGHEDRRSATDVSVFGADCHPPRIIPDFVSAGRTAVVLQRPELRASAVGRVP